MALAPLSLTLWSISMRKLFAACKRLDDHWLGDLIAVALLSSLVPLTLFIGSVLDGGM